MSEQLENRSGVFVAPATEPDDLDAVRHLCWAYRDFLLNMSEVDRQITETFYPVEKYQKILEEMPELHARPKGMILIAKDGSGAPLGCGMSHALDDETSEIKRVFVNAAARGQGVARMICEDLLRQARQDGFSRVVLDTSKSLTAAQRLYDRLGFAQRGPYQPIPQDVLPALLFYEKDLSTP